MSLTSREKSPGAFRTISEVANKLELPQHVLRFWETKFTQIKPIKRRGGRRYYRPEDVQVLERIRNLLHKEGYTIKGAQNYLRQHSQNLENELPLSQPETPSILEEPELQPEAQSKQMSSAANTIDKDELIGILLELKDIKNLIHSEIL